MKNLFSKILSYSIADLISKSIPFFLLPILTRYLTPSEFGYVSILQITWQFFSILLGFGLASLISVSYFKESLDVFNNIKRQVISFSLTMSLLFLIITIGFSIIGIISEVWIVIISSSSVSAILSFFLANIQAEKDANKFGILQIIMAIVNCITSVVLVTFFELGVMGRVIGFTVSPFVGILLLYISGYFSLKDLYFFNFNISTLKGNFSLAIHQVSNWARYSVDKYIISLLLGHSLLGIYNVTFQLAFVMSMLVMILNRAIQPFMFERLNNQRSISDIILLQTILSGAFLLISSFLFPRFASYLIGGGFDVQWDVYYILNVSFLIQGFYLSICNILYFHKKNRSIAFNSTLCLIITILLSYFMVSNFSLIGAASSILITMTLLFILTLKDVVKLRA